MTILWFNKKHFRFRGIILNSRSKEKNKNQNKLRDLKLCSFSYTDNKLRRCLGELQIIHSNALF